MISMSIAHITKFGLNLLAASDARWYFSSTERKVCGRTY